MTDNVAGLDVRYPARPQGTPKVKLFSAAGRLDGRLLELGQAECAVELAPSAEAPALRSLCVLVINGWRLFAAVTAVELSNVTLQFESELSGTKLDRALGRAPGGGLAAA